MLAHKYLDQLTRRGNFGQRQVGGRINNTNELGLKCAFSQALRGLV